MCCSDLYDYEEVEYAVTFTVRGKKCYPVSTYKEIMQDPGVVDEDIINHVLNHWDDSNVECEVELL